MQLAAAEEAAQHAAAEHAAAEQAAAEQAAAEHAAQQAAAEQAAAEQAAQQAAAEQAAEDAAANANADPSFKVLHSRDEDPSASSPLTYRERSYALPPGTPLDEAERFIRNQADALMAELDHVAKGRFLNLAAFDHEWSGKPTRKPLVTLALKDWQGDAVVERHQPSVPPPRARRSNTDEHDRRLADAFEACQDLLFLATPLEAVDFAQKLLSDLIPCEATAGALYDIDDSVHRIVSATGPGAEERKGASVPHDAGIFGAVTASRSTVVFPSDDTRYAAEHDGRPGLQVRDGLYAACMHDGRFFGVLQLLNSTNGTFDQSDADLARYVAGQLGEFLARARASMRAQR
ncbi:MAG: GAF domain-containing protein [Myxococcota bacterium]